MYWHSDAEVYIEHFADFKEIKCIKHTDLIRIHGELLFLLP